MSPSLHQRRGMTLVELLVVVAIVGLLAVTVLPNISNTAESRRGREAARMVSSFVAKAQSRALGRQDWSGVMLPAMNVAMGGVGDLFLADVPPAYRGDTVSATLMITGSTPTTRIASSLNGGVASFIEMGIKSDDFIRFNGRGPIFQIDHNPAPGVPVTATSIRFEPRGFEAGADEYAGAELRNTPWPPSNVPLTFEIFRQPFVAGSPLSLSDGRAVDLSWSGLGLSGVAGGASTFERFAPIGGVTAVTLLFDGTGRLRQAVVGSDRKVVTGPVYLLVGRVDRVIRNPLDLNDPNQPEKLIPTDDTTGANWQYPDSWWVAIDPMTGVAKSAECVPGAATVIESQQWIRAALLGTGR